MKERKRRHLSIARDAAETGTNPARIRHGPGARAHRPGARAQEPGGFARLAREPPGARGGFVPMPRNAHA
ncbi:hypothetical protein M218_08470 [Burkholderia pseudomallei MSHR338]|nr:hypothetical protein M218_08470 [Burkholderia pseudomallei MSHR338]OMW22759.1 hypothetical protein AQ806_08385 [Burkholderia pseudomallei]OMW36731.1 hypothetical protein AQ807_01885 [Burkholderia pseudomallei]ONA25985.1 hypothetical protein AQ879_09545 [Burkholderia pseudomallei]ONA36311.1 hypothetical protein AQ880_31025 [Burkholderia pseudomallei]